MIKKEFSLYAMQLFAPLEGSKELRAQFETKELLFRPTVSTDKHALDKTCFGNATTMSTYANREPQPFKRTNNRCVEHEARRESGNPLHGFTIIEKSSGHIIGLVNSGAGITDENDNPIAGDSELGIIIHHEKWGNGYGPQAVKAIVDHYLPLLRAHGFENHGKIITTSSATVLKEGNERSVKMLSAVYGQNADAMDGIIKYSADERLLASKEVRADQAAYDAFISFEKFEDDSAPALVPAP